MLSREDAQDSEFRSFFGRIEDTIICFQDCLTFSNRKISQIDLYIMTLCACTTWQIGKAITERNLGG